MIKHYKSGHIMESLFNELLHFLQSSPTILSQVGSDMILRKYSLSKIEEKALKILKSALPLKMLKPCSRVFTIC